MHRKLRTRWALALLLAGIAVACGKQAPLPSAAGKKEAPARKELPPPPPELERVTKPAASVDSPAFALISTEQSGIDFRYYNDGQGNRFHTVETNGAGLGWLDFDNDGLLDLYCVNGCPLPFDDKVRTHRNRLFHNGPKFTQVAEFAGVADHHFGAGVAVGDFDNDGWVDLCVCNFGPTLLFRNQGDGTFTQLPTSSFPDVPGWNSGAAFGDIDRDGDLDLYITVYAKDDLANTPSCSDTVSGKFRVYCGPNNYTAARHHLLINGGAGQFLDQTTAAGCDQKVGKGMGVVMVDLDLDGWPEIYVANDMSPAYLYVNQERQLGKAPRFRDVAAESGVAFDGNGNLAAGMGVAVGDVDGDKLIDLYVTHYHRQGSSLYRNTGGLAFVDEASARNLFVPSLPFVGFGCEFLDFDNDGWLDLYTVNGHVLGPHYPDSKMISQLYRNKGAGQYDEISASAGAFFGKKILGRGSATCDYDNDGAIDFAVLSLDEPVALLRNVFKPRGHGLLLDFVGKNGNRDGIQCVVSATLGKQEILRQVIGGGSYQSAPDRRLHLGLGDKSKVDSLVVRWSSGVVSRWNDVAADQLLVLVEGEAPIPVAKLPSQAR